MERTDNDISGLAPNEQHQWQDERGRSLVYRSDGGGLIIASWCCVAISLLCFFAGMTITTQDYAGSIDPSAIQLRFIAYLLGGLFAWFWALLFGVGHIVRAIYFVPGEAMKVCADTAVVRGKIKSLKAVKTVLDLK